jgi:hypothetical protein
MKPKTSTKVRRHRADSAAGAVEAMQAAAVMIQPPAAVTLTGEARVLFDSIARSRAPEEWDAPSLHAAAQLARDLTHAEVLAREIAIEGDIVAGHVSPRHRLLDVVTGRAVRFTRLLQLHPRARLGEHRDVAKRRSFHADAVSVIDAQGGDFDDLLA